MGAADPDGTAAEAAALKFGGGIIAKRILAAGAVTEAGGLVADGTIAGAPAGVITNVAGAVIDVVGTAWAAYHYFHQTKPCVSNASGRGRLGSNQAENAEFGRLARQYGLTDDEQREVHNGIEHGDTIKEIEDAMGNIVKRRGNGSGVPGWKK